MYSLTLFANEQKNVLIIHSYSQEYTWTKNQHEGFIRHLQKNLKEPLEISTEHLDTKRVEFNEEYQRKFIEYINMKYKDSSPAVIYVTDDNALNFMLKNQNTLSFNAPVVFSGINNLELKKHLNPKRFTGVYEIKDVEQNIQLIKTFSPQTKEIYFVGDATETYFAIEQEIKSKQENFPNIRFHFIHAKKFSEVHVQLQKLPARSFVLLTTIGGFEMDDGVNQTLQYSINALSKIDNIILMSMEDAYIQNKVIGGYVTNGIKQGELAAQKVQSILQNIPVHEIKSTFSDANTYMFNREALLEAQIYLPEHIKHESIILNEEMSFYIRHESTILNSFFLILIFTLAFLSLIYFISREKKQELLQSKNTLLELQKKLQRNHAIVENIQQLTHAIYWELDIETSQILLINNTNIELALQSQTTSSYDDFINYFIYPKDFHIFKKALSETKASLKGATIEHSILLRDSSSISVINSFECHSINNQAKKIAGLMQLLDETQH
jgi:ABC-type uncharacterized transport system substrate-binding protein